MANMNEQEVRMIQGFFKDGTSKSETSLLRVQMNKQKSSPNELSLNLTITSRQGNKKFEKKNNKQNNYYGESIKKFPSEKKKSSISNPMEIAQIAATELKKFNANVTNHFSRNQQLIQLLQKCEHMRIQNQDYNHLKFQALNDIILLTKQAKKQNKNGNIFLDRNNEQNGRIYQQQIATLKNKIIIQQQQIHNLKHTKEIIQIQKDKLIQQLQKNKQIYTKNIEDLNNKINKVESQLSIEKIINQIQMRQYIDMLTLQNKSLSEKVINMSIEIQKQKLERTNWLNKSKTLEQKLKNFENSGKLRLMSNSKNYSLNENSISHNVSFENEVTDTDINEWIRIFTHYSKLYKKKWDVWKQQFIQKNNRNPTNQQIQNCDKYDICVHIKNFRSMITELKVINQIRLKYKHNYESPNPFYQKSKSPFRDSIPNLRGSSNILQSLSNFQDQKTKDNSNSTELEFYKKEYKKIKQQNNRLQNENKNLIQNANQLKQRLMDIAPSSKEENQQLQQELERLLKDCNHLQKQNQQLHNKLKNQIQKNQLINKQKQEKNSQLEKKLNILRKKYHIQVQKSKKFENQNIQIKQNFQINIKDLQFHLNKQRCERRRLHNELEDIKGNIRVYCRVRPLLKNQIQRKSKNIIQVNQDSIIIVERTKKYKYDAVFGSNSSQQQVFQDTKKLIQSSFDGYNVCIFAYGQTGSGKTYTLHGNKQHPGIASRSIGQLFRLASQLKNQFTVTIQMNMVEIYLDNLIDLYDINNKQKKVLQIREDARGVYVHGCHRIKVNSAEMMETAYRNGLNNRKVSSTQMNNQSSRSHLIFMVFVEIQNNKTHQKRHGKFSLVDLAGSQRSAKSYLKSNQMKQSQSINKSLTALNDVIVALNSKDSHIPYRNHKLTFLLKDSIGGNSKTLMFINISPAQYNIDQTCTSLLFANRVKCVEKNTPLINVQKQKIYEQDQKMRKSLPKNEYI